MLPSNGTEVHDAQAVARECQKMTPKDVMHAATVYVPCAVFTWWLAGLDLICMYGRHRSVICGDGAVGKTCVFNRSFEAVQDAEAEKRAGTLAAQNFDPTDQEYEPTIFEDYSGQAVDVCGHLKGLPALDEAITVTLRDTAGACALAQRWCWRWRWRWRRRSPHAAFNPYAVGRRPRGVRRDQRRQLPRRRRLHPGVRAKIRQWAVQYYT